MAVIDGVFCLSRECYQHTRDALQSLRVTSEIVDSYDTVMRDRMTK